MSAPVPPLIPNKASSEGIVRDPTTVIYAPMDRRPRSFLKVTVFAVLMGTLIVLVKPILERLIPADRSNGEIAGVMRVGLSAVSVLIVVFFHIPRWRARNKALPNQSSDPAFASGTSRAGHEPRHR
jgi:hypothetical protein